MKMFPALQMDKSAQQHAPAYDVATLNLAKYVHR